VRLQQILLLREMKDESAVYMQRFVRALEAGLPPSHVDAMDAAEAHRQHIAKWFYPCSYEMHRNLGGMYLADERFTQFYERIKAGLAAYVSAAIEANADRHS
jgi:hypothetical protein